MSRYFFTFGLLMGTVPAEISGQGIPPIQTDRPDQTECPFIVPKKHFQMENGFTSEKTNKKTTSFFHPSSLWKYGVSNNFELRMVTGFATVNTGDEALTGLNPVTFGFKVNLTGEKGIIPITSFIGHLTVPDLASPQFKAACYAPAFRFTMQHSLSEKFDLAYNVGAEWDGESAQPIFIYTLTTGYSISEKTGCYIEVYGFAPEKLNPDHRVDGGL